MEQDDHLRHSIGSPMMAGRPRMSIGTSGAMNVRRRDNGAIAETRIRDADGRVRHVRVTARTAEQARSKLKQRLLSRPGVGISGAGGSPFFRPLA